MFGWMPLSKMIELLLSPKRMDRVKVKMSDPDPSWLDLVGECYRKGISLTASHM